MKFLGIILMLAISVGCGGASPSSPKEQPVETAPQHSGDVTPQLVPDNKSPSEWFVKLRSPKPSEYRLAQFHLGQLGAVSLAQLDQLAKTKDHTLRQRISEIVSLLYQGGLDPDDVQDFEALLSACEPELQAAEEVSAKLLREVARIQNNRGVDGSKPIIDFFNEQTNQLWLELSGYHGWAFPAYYKFARGKQAYLKKTAIDIIIASSGSQPSTVLLEQLQNDDSEIYAFYADYGESTTTAAYVAQLLKARPHLLPGTRKPARWRLNHLLECLNQIHGVTTSERGLFGWPNADFSWPDASSDELAELVRREMVRVWDTPE